MSSMTDREAGEWVATVKTLIASVDKLSERMESMERQAAYGKGVLWGMLTVATGVGGLAMWIVGRIWP